VEPLTVGGCSAKRSGTAPADRGARRRRRFDGASTGDHGGGGADPGRRPRGQGILVCVWAGRLGTEGGEEGRGGGCRGVLAKKTLEAEGVAGGRMQNGRGSIRDPALQILVSIVCTGGVVST
jgi:hypothetical protein